MESVIESGSVLKSNNESGSKNEVGKMSSKSRGISRAIMNNNDLQEFDPEVYQVIRNEIKRQNHGIELIASENFVSKAVMQAMGTVLTNKYSEGYPGKRYYGGNEFVDITENLAIERAKKLFGAEHCNVQPHAGSQANIAAYFAVLELKDKILGMNLAHGGHLTHGSPVNFSGKFYSISAYGVDRETGMINMDEVAETARKERPKLILAGASAYPRKLDFKKFRAIADEVGAYFMVDMAHIAGLIAAKIHPDPVPYADIVTTTTHKTLRGPRSAMILSKIEDRFKPDPKKTLAKKIDSAVFPGMQGGPMDHIIAAKAVAFKEAMQPDFVEYQKQIVSNGTALAEALMDNSFALVSNGTDNHLMLVDLTNKHVTGKQAESALEKSGIYVNKNMVPFDPRSPFDPSGIRIGTPAMTTRGMKEDEMREIGNMITKVIHNISDESIHSQVKKKVEELCSRFKIY